jgi:hypothetical protein
MRNFVICRPGTSCAGWDCKMDGGKRKPSNSGDGLRLQPAPFYSFYYREMTQEARYVPVPLAMLRFVPNPSYCCSPATALRSVYPLK